LGTGFQAINFVAIRPYLASTFASMISFLLNTPIPSANFVAGEQEQKLRDFLFPERVACVAAIGTSAEWMADQAGFSVPQGTKSLVVEIDEISIKDPVSKEKMFPVLGYITVDGVDQGIATALAMRGIRRLFMLMIRPLWLAMVRHYPFVALRSIRLVWWALLA